MINPNWRRTAGRSLFKRAEGVVNHDLRCSTGVVDLSTVLEVFAIPLFAISSTENAMSGNKKSSVFPFSTITGKGNRNF
jgi:hypothetical protein